jgi:hypothetical protein
MTATITKAPKTQLGPRERVKSAADVERALEELSLMESTEEAVNARVKQRCDLVKGEESKRLFVMVGDKEVAFADRREHLESRIREYMVECGESFFPEGMKTRVFTHGEISSKVQPERVAYIDGATPTSVLERIEKKTGLVGKILEILQSLKLFSVPLGKLIKCEPKLDLNAAKSALKSGELKESEFRSLGLAVERPAEKLYIKPAKYLVQSESAA